MLWLISLKIRNVAIVDIFWGLGFVIVAVFCGLAINFRWISASHSLAWQQWLLIALVTLWGVRLATYLTVRNWGKPEDYRYAAMREHWGAKFWYRSFFTVFGLQAALISWISIPIVLGLAGNIEMSMASMIGLAFWSIGVFFETVGDWQMWRFKKDPTNRGRVMDQGLWRYTRHPNYFGDFMVWWGLYLFSAQPESWWWAVLCPITMSILLLRVSGVTLLESSLRKRVSGYQDYLDRTSSFFPWPPKNVDRQVGNRQP